MENRGPFSIFRSAACPTDAVTAIAVISPMTDRFMWILDSCNRLDCTNDGLAAGCGTSTRFSIWRECAKCVEPPWTYRMSATEQYRRIGWLSGLQYGAPPKLVALLLPSPSPNSVPGEISGKS